MRDHFNCNSVPLNSTMQWMGKHKVLCIDDEVDNVEALERLFRKKYDIIKATSGQEALDWLNQNPGPIALIITDQRMPEMTGVEFLEKTLSSHPETVRILLTGYTDLESVILAVNQGQIYRYLTKPWDPLDLSQTVERAIERYELSQELKEKNKELAIAIEELRTLDEAKSNFMILINHELKTPLTSILNFGSLLEETELDEDQKKYLNRIKKSTGRLKNLVDDVLLIMKAETQQLKTDKKSVAIEPVVEAIARALKSDLASKKQTVRLKTSQSHIDCNELILQQVLTRLLQNAQKFGTPEQPILIECQLLANSKTQVKISNNGPQISEKIMEKIFKPFHIEENIMNHSTGTGLGLTVCQSLLHLVQSGIQLRNTSSGVTLFFEI